MRYIPALCAAFAVCACTMPGSVTRAPEQPLDAAPFSRPDGAAEGTCWDKTDRPAVERTVTENVIVQPAEISSSGQVLRPPVTRVQTRQVLLQDRQITWYEVVCDSDLTPAFVEDVQRALSLRGFYRGTPNGTLDAATRGAIRRYQTAEALQLSDPGRLTVEAARKLGLRAIPTLPG